MRSDDARTVTRRRVPEARPPLRRLAFRLGLAAAALLSVARTAAAQTPARAAHVVLISVDGLRPEFYRDPAWPAPTMQQMAREGAHALGVRGVFPSVTYPSHTTIVTGALPARHGVLYNTPFEPAGQTGRWYWEESAIRVPTLWDALRASGRKSAAVFWPVTVGAPIDWLVPEIFSADPKADPIALLRGASTPGLLDELERKATGQLTPRNFGGDDLTRDDREGAMAAYLLETYKPAVVAVHLLGADHFQHAEGRDGVMVRRAVAAVDRAVTQIVEAAARSGILDRTTFVVTGDHGFVNTQTRLDPNVWLAAARLTDTTPSRGDWRATFHASGGSAFLHLRRRGDARTLAAARRAIAAQPAAVRRLFRVVEREELDRIGADPAAALALAAAQGVAFGSAARGPAAVAAASGGTHGYFPTDFPEIRTGLVAWGAGVRPGVVVPELGLEHVAPLVAALLGVPFAPADGLLHPGILTEPAAPARAAR
jgi:hypothetical protein